MNSIPIIKMVLDPNDPGLGLKLMSMVESPAIMINWVKFSDSEPVKFKIQNEDQRIVFGPALVPDLPIYRNIGGKEFFLTIDAQTILETSIKFAKDNLFNKVDTNHNQQLIPGVTIFESFVTSKERVLKVSGFEDLPEGTLFFSAKVNDEQTWNRIKTGELNGWSIDALFKFQPDEPLTDKEIQKITKEILNT